VFNSRLSEVTALIAQAKTMKQPHKYPKRILLAVSGMSPQIVTETLYSLAINQQNPFIPTDIHLITTLSGAAEARLLLLHAKTGKFLAFCQDYQLTNIHFPEENIHIIQDKQGNLLNDIKTPEQNEAAADFITETVRLLTEDDNSALHVSIAGGRKTMGYYLGYALSLYGRNQDRLSHVLVTDRYESLKDFFYPTPDSRVIQDKQGQALDAQAAEVMLAEIPFVRMRGGIPHHLLTGKTSFNESIKFARRIETEPKLQIDNNSKTLWVDDVQIKLSEIHFVFYLWLLERSLNGVSTKRTPADNNHEYAAEYLVLYQQTYHPKEITRTQKLLVEGGMQNQWMSERISKIKQEFEKALGQKSAKAFIVQSTGKNNNLHYAIALTENQISYFSAESSQPGNTEPQLGT